MAENETPFDVLIAEDPEARLPGENMLWYSRFLTWLKMPQPRSALEICNREREKKGKKRGKKFPGSWEKTRVLFCWSARAEIWDTANVAKREAERAEEMELKRRLRLEAIERQYQREIDNAELLDAKAKEILKLPHVAQEITKLVDGVRQEIEIKPIRSAEFAAATRMLESSSTLARRGLGLPRETHQIDVTWKQEAVEYGIDTDVLFERLLRLAVESRTTSGPGAGDSQGNGGRERLLEGPSGTVTTLNGNEYRQLPAPTTDE